MPEVELLPRAVTRNDERTTSQHAEVEEGVARRPAHDEDPPSPARSSDSTTSTTISTVVVDPPLPPRRPSIWQLPFCSGDTSWLHVSNTIVYFVVFCVNVLVNSGAVWMTVRQVDELYGPVVTPAHWSYYVRDLALFLWGLAVACQNLVEHKGWKEGLLGFVGHSWQILWYSDSIWLLLHVTATPTGLALAPFFSLAALLAALATLTRLAWGMHDLHLELQAEGFEGVPALGYLLFAYPTSLYSGWLLVLHCHSTTLAAQVITGSYQAATTIGCVALVLSTAVALLLLVRFRDLVFGCAFTWSMAAVWVAGFSSNDDYGPDQLVAFFCALVLGLLTYCVAAGPQAAIGAGPLAGAGGLHS